MLEICLPALTPFSLILFSTLFLCPGPGSHSGLPDLSFFSGAVPVASSEFSVVGGIPLVAGERPPGNWRPPTSGVCSGWIRDWGPAQPPPRGHDLARSFQTCWPTSALEGQTGAYHNSLNPVNPRAQGYSLRPISSRAKGDTLEEEGPSLSVLQPKETAIPTEIASLYINIGDTKWILHCQVEGCPEGPSTSHATICAHVHQAHLGRKLMCPSCPSTFFNTDALRWYGKWAHHSGSSDST